MSRIGADMTRIGAGITLIGAGSHTFLVRMTRTTRMTRMTRMGNRQGPAFSDFDMVGLDYTTLDMADWDGTLSDDDPSHPVDHDPSHPVDLSPVLDDGRAAAASAAAGAGESGGGPGGAPYVSGQVGFEPLRPCHTFEYKALCKQSV